MTSSTPQPAGPNNPPPPGIAPTQATSLPSGPDPIAALKYRRWSTALIIGFVAICLGFSVIPLVNSFRKPDGNKDYARWYDAGRHVLHGQPLYEAQEGHDKFDFLYPPFAAVGLFAIPSLLGPTGVVATLILLSSALWILSALIGVWLYTGRWRHPELLLYIVPIAVVLPYAWDIYFLGQPNIILLGLLMLSFLSLRLGYGWIAGLTLAAAAALKAFPIVLIGYFVWKRQWVAVASTFIFLCVLLWGLPGVVRGFERNNAEMMSWYQNMIVPDSNTNIAQRAGIAFQWRNQSLLSTVHRLTRHVSVDDLEIKGKNGEPDRTEPVYVNFIDIGPQGSKIAYYTIAAIMGLTFAVITLGDKGRTPRSDAIEAALALGLVLFATPKAGTYYYIWLLFPLAVACAFIYEAKPGSSRRRTAMWLTGVSILILSTAITQPVNHMTQAYGATTWGGVVLWCSLVWMYRCLRGDQLASDPLPAAN